MPTITHTDYLFQATASGVGLVPGVWVRLLNNSTVTNYYSTAVTDATSAFTHSAPPGDYSLYTGNAATVPGTPTLRNAHYSVPVTAGDDAALGSVTALPSSPYAPLAGLPAGATFAAIFDNGGYAYNLKSGPTPALIDNSTDDTINIQATSTRAAVTGGIVLWPQGTGIVDFATGVQVGSGGSLTNACLKLASNLELRGVGTGVSVMKLKAVTRTPNVSGAGQSMVINANPNLTTDANINIRDLTIDGNRDNQGPYANQNISLAVAANFAYRGLSYWAGSGFGADNVEVRNMPDFAVFVEANATNLGFGDIYMKNCTAGLSIDQATNGTATRVVANNSDAAYTVNTTSTSTVVGGSSQTFVVGSATGIAINDVLALGIGTSAFENILVTNVVGTSITGYCANNHGPSSFTVNNARFNSDGAVQMNLLAKRFTVDAIDVDYTGALAVVGPALEISGAQGIAIGMLVARGTFRAVWLHSWNIGATHYIPTDIAIIAVVAENLVSAASGVFCQAFYIDDHGLVAGADLIKDISVSSLVVRFGKDAAAIPNACSGIQIQPNVTNATFSDVQIDGPYWGLILNGCSGNKVNGRITNTQNQAIQIQANASRNRLDVSIDTTGVANAAAGAGIQFVDATACDDNVITILANGVPGASAAIDLSASLGKNNRFDGNVRPCFLPVLLNTATPQVNYFNLVGYGAPGQMYFTSCTADFTGTNVTTAQPVFNTTEDVIALPASTSYMFEGIYHIHTTGTASHTFGILFGGTATLTSIDYAASVTNVATEVLGAEQTLWATAATVQVLTAATATATHHTVRLKGIVRINAAGTFIPQYQWGTTAPGVAGVTLRNSYFKLIPLGLNTQAAFGNWN